MSGDWVLILLDEHDQPDAGREWGNNRVGYIDKQSAAIYTGVDKQQEKPKEQTMTCDESYTTSTDMMRF